MDFTRGAMMNLETVPLEDRERVAQWSERLARHDGSQRVLQSHVRSAWLCGGEEFLPKTENDPAAPELRDDTDRFRHAEELT